MRPTSSALAPVKLTRNSDCSGTRVTIAFIRRADRAPWWFCDEFTAQVARVEGIVRRCCVGDEWTQQRDDHDERYANVNRDDTRLRLSISTTSAAVDSEVRTGAPALETKHSARSDVDDTDLPMRVGHVRQPQAARSPALAAPGHSQRAASVVGGGDPQPAAPAFERPIAQCACRPPSDRAPIGDPGASRFVARLWEVLLRHV